MSSRGSGTQQRSNVQQNGTRMKGSAPETAVVAAQSPQQNEQQISATASTTTSTSASLNIPNGSAAMGSQQSASNNAAAVQSNNSTNNFNNNQTAISSSNHNNNNTTPTEQPKRHHEHYQILLQDMGLDFKSYQSLTRGDGIQKAVSNQFVINGDEAIRSTEPTLGLLILILHSAQHCSGQTLTRWLRLYREVQEAIASGALSVTEPRMLGMHSNQAKIIEMGMRAVDAIDSEVEWDLVATMPRQFTQDLIRRLFVLLDEQSGIRGHNQSPSSRRVQTDPKGMLCNLYLTSSSGKAGGGCQQGFLCNQIHLSAERGWENRGQFFTALGSALLDRGVRVEEVLHRVKDAIFYAKYANKVTLKVHGGYIIFFKTCYTRGRLNNALGCSKDYCPAKGNASMCAYGENCSGIHIGDSHGLNNGKSSDPLDSLVSEDLAKEGEEYMASAMPSEYIPLVRRPQSSATASTQSVAIASGGAVRDGSATPPLTQSWAQCASGVVPKNIDPKLLDQLANVSGSPAGGHGYESGGDMTPILKELYQNQHHDEEQ